MIIIQTKNGATMVNENAITLLTHLKDKERVVINSHGLPTYIDDVEQVRYTNKEENFRDEGSLVERLNQWLDREGNDRRVFVKRIHDMEKGISDIVINIDSVAYDLDKDLKNKLHTISSKAHELNNADWGWPEEDKMIPNEVLPYIEKLKAKIEELEGSLEYEKGRADLYQDFFNYLMNRSLWERIKNDYPTVDIVKKLSQQ